MSVALENAIMKILGSTKTRLTPEDIVAALKKLPEYQRHQNSALKVNVVKILDKYRKENEAQNEKTDSSLSSDKTHLGKKRKKEKDDSPMFPSQFDVSKFIYKPNVKLSNLGGMDEIVNELKQIISNPLYHYDAYKQMKIEPIKGVLLCGPPGCGKTTLAYAIGGEFDIPFYKITGPDIISSLSGESEQIIRNLFKAVVMSAPSILFIDEIETILGKRESAGKEMERRIVAQIMSCIDDINMIQLTTLEAPVFIIGATSKPEFIDNSMRRSGRFDKEIHIGFPTLDMRKEMIMSITKGKRLSPSLDFNKLAQGTPGYLAADLQSLVRTAGHHAINRLISNNLNIDELTIEQCDFDYGISIIQPTSKREGFTTIPNVTWKNIGGLKDLREELYYDIVLPCLEPTTLQKVGINKAVGVLLYGPPGCGKTLLAKAVANEARANFISIKGPELLNKYVGESEKAIRSLFIRARNSSPCIIFFDELDALVPKRSQENNNAGERVVNQLLTEMDGLEERKQIFIIAATNRPDIIDPAMLRPGRLDKLLYVPLPSKEDRLSILQTITQELPIEKDKSINLEEINEKTDGFSGADIAALVRETQLNALKRMQKLIGIEGIEKENGALFRIEKADFDQSLKTIFKSVSDQDRKRYETIKKIIQESRSHITK